MACPRPVSGWAGWSLWVLFWSISVLHSFPSVFPLWGAENLLRWDEAAWRGLQTEACCSPCWRQGDSGPCAKGWTLDSHFIQAIRLPGASHWAPGIRRAPRTLGKQPSFLHTLPLCCLRAFGVGHLGWFCHSPLPRRNVEGKIAVTLGIPGFVS